MLQGAFANIKNKSEDFFVACQVPVLNIKSFSYFYFQFQVAESAKSYRLKRIAHETSTIIL